MQSNRGYQSFQAILGAFQAHLPAVLGEDQTKDVATQNRRGYPVSTPPAQLDAAIPPPPPMKCASVVDDSKAPRTLRDDVVKGLSESIQMMKDHEKERVKLVSKLTQSVEGIQAELIKMEHENFSFRSKLTALPATDTTANAHLSEMDKKLATAENERKAIEEANKSLRAELDLINIEKHELKIKLQATDNTAKKLEGRLIQSENDRKALETSNESLRSELTVVNSKKRQLESTLEDTKVLKCEVMHNLEAVTSDLQAIQQELLATKAEYEALSNSKSTYQVLCKHLTKALVDQKRERAANREENERLRNEISLSNEK